MSGQIGITLGDVSGVGPEVTLKALAALLDEDDARYLIIGDEDEVRRTNDRLKLKLRFEHLSEAHSGERLCTTNSFGESIPEKLPAGSPVAARAAVAWLADAAQRCQKGELDAVVTAPVNKEAIVRSGQTFVGQTEFLSQLAGAQRTAMMLLGHDERERWLRVALVTTHIPLKQVPANITPAKISRAIELAAKACADLGLSRSRIAVCGLNPHAGEGGQMGDEETTTIGPTVLAAQKNGFDVVGPLSGDTVFHHALRGEYDAVVAMYHDQGLAPLKAVAFDTGVNWTLGLPFIRTSPDHGTAYDIAGRGIANPSSMISALRLARELAKKGN
ncbi:MAG TPA: 4-hydroxythreonine-4-phosphate dehydrogenase PdxA [Verrucomicrobiae bacterium]|nr:4-hydroxythreonine-4-phosphate dehydrogenase PdxA [Verrucomicrobiae bacterium]